MRASLAQNEPKRLALWNQNALYELLMKKNEGHEKFVLHDGPPYANGPIHLGHAQNHARFSNSLYPRLGLPRPAH